jgi:hypothetical protein
MKIRRARNGIAAIPPGGMIWPPLAVTVERVFVEKQDPRGNIVLGPEKIILNSAYPGRKEWRVK